MPSVDILSLVLPNNNDIDLHHMVDSHHWLARSHRERLLDQSSLPHFGSHCVMIFRLLPSLVSQSYSKLMLSYSFFFAKKGLHFYYAWDRDRKEERLRELKKQKRKILEKVRETETYNNAEEILKKYDPKSVERVQQSPSVISPQRFTPIESQLRYRGNLTPMRSLPALPSGSSFTPQTGYGLRPQIPVGLARGSMVTPVRPPLMATPMPAIRTIKPIVAQNRSIVEKVVDYMVGDGPNNRYALICIHCYSHNGMALKDEFEFIAFRCCYCRGFNPARKMRPQPPRLDSIDHLSRRSSSLTPLIDEPESDTDSERGPKIVEKSSRINEVHNQSDNEGQSEDQIDSETKIKTTDVNDSVVHNESNNTQTSVSEKEVESKVNDKHETNSEAIVGKDMPFIDEANDESNDSSL